MQKIFIAGAWLDAAEAAARTPQSGNAKPHGAVRECGREDVARASPQRTLRSPHGRQLQPAARGELLGDVAARIRGAKRSWPRSPRARTVCPSAILRLHRGRCIHVRALGSARRRGGRWPVGETSVSGARARRAQPASAGAAGMVGALLPRYFPASCPRRRGGSRARRRRDARAAGACRQPAREPGARAAFEGLPAGAVNVITAARQTARALIEHAPAERMLFTEPAAADAFIVCRDADLDLRCPASVGASAQRRPGVRFGTPYLRRALDRRRICGARASVRRILGRRRSVQAADRSRPVDFARGSPAREDQVGRTLRAAPSSFSAAVAFSRLVCRVTSSNPPC